MRQIQQNIARALRRSKEERQRTLEEFSEELSISRTAMCKYLRGEANPTVDTLALLAGKLGITPAELISDEPDGWQQAELLLRTAKELSTLPAEQQRKVIELFLALVSAFSE